MITIQRYPKSIYFYCAVSTGCEKLTGLPDLEPLRERLDVLLKDQFCVSFTTFADLCLLNICRMNKSVVFGLWINNDPYHPTQIYTNIIQLSCDSGMSPCIYIYIIINTYIYICYVYIYMCMLISQEISSHSRAFSPAQPHGHEDILRRLQAPGPAVSFWVWGICRILEVKHDAWLSQVFQGAARRCFAA